MAQKHGVDLLIGGHDHVSQVWYTVYVTTDTGLLDVLRTLLFQGSLSASDHVTRRLVEVPSRGKALREKKVVVVLRRIMAYSKPMCLTPFDTALKTVRTSLIKSGTDFRDLSEAILELEEQPAGSIRRRVISKLTGKTSLAGKGTATDLSNRQTPRNHSGDAIFRRD